MGSTTSATDVKLNGNITAQTNGAVNTIHLDGNALTFLDNTQVLDVAGILSNGGSLTAGTLQGLTAGGEIVFNVSGGNLSAASTIQNSRLTKTGAGTLALSGTNTYTGVTVVNAGTLAPNGGVLWLSAVWHFQDSNFFAPVGIALTAGGGLVERARTVSNSPAGTGNAMGVGNGKDINSGEFDLNPTFWSNGTESAQTFGTNISTTQDNIIILKFEFGTTDTVRAWYFTEGQTITEAAFNANARSCTSTIDENSLNTLAFSTVRVANAVDEFRIGTTLQDVITAGGLTPRQNVQFTVFDYNKATNQFNLTWKSNPGETYAVYGSETLSDFRPHVAPVVPAHPTARETSLSAIPHPQPGAPKYFFTIGLPDTTPPSLERSWGVGNKIRLDFSEPMLATHATNIANYTVTKAGGGAVPLVSAVLYPTADIVELTTSAPLELNTAYTITMANLTDLAERPLPTPAQTSIRTWDDNPNGVQVYVLAGQSNMVGYGESEKGVGGVNGAIGSLRERVTNDPAGYGHLVNGDGTWKTRTDVKVWWNKAELGARSSVTKGNLGIGFASNTARIGPEYGFGWVIGDVHTAPVLIIKSAWGGKDLYTNFRPPGAVAARGGKNGPYYVRMIEQVHEVLDNLGTAFPEWAGLGYRIVGFGWHQGYNDRLNTVMSAGYEANLADLIQDLRREFGKPSLPVAIATTGMGISGAYSAVETAQLAVANPSSHPEFADTVFTRDTRPFWRDKTVSPADQSHHWNLNGESYYLIGQAMGQGMAGLPPP